MIYNRNKMEITSAQLIIKNLITTRTSELLALQTASDLLNNTFKADFTALETAQKEANDKAIEVSAKTTDIANLTTTVQTLTTTVTNKDQEISDLTVTKEDLQSQLDTLQTAPIMTPPIDEKPVDIIK